MSLSKIALFGLAAVAGMAQAANFELTIMHTNDVHARITSSDEKGELVGGVARRMTKIKEVRAAKTNTLLLDAGDQFQGTVWFNIYNGQEAAHFMNMLGYDAQALGNHEFDKGTPTLGAYLDSVKYPVLSCNIDATADKYINGKFKPYVIVEKSGRKIAIIGYTTEDTLFLSSPSKETKFTPMAEALPATVTKIKAENPDVNIIIAVGHAGNAVDLKLAAANPDIDIIVGGHTNTFIYTGEPIHKEVPEGPYPQIVKHADGRQSLVITDYAFGKYLGILDAVFDDKGDLVSYTGNPWLLSDKTTETYNATPEDPTVAAEVAIWEKNVTALMEEKVGKNMLYLMGDRLVCRQQECNLGNLLADSYVNYMMKMADNGAIAYKPAMAWINGGSVRSDINVGEVTMAHVLEVVPFQNTIVVVHVPGSELKTALEHGVGSIEEGEGRFPQISGFTFTFDAKAPKGKRVVDVKVPCLSCDHPKLVPVNDSEIYPIITSSYMAAGGDGYEMWADKKVDDFSILDSDPVVEYFKGMSPVHLTEQGRITRLEGAAASSSAAADCPAAPACPECPAASTSSGSNVATLVAGAVAAVALIAAAVLGVLYMKVRSRLSAKEGESRVSLN